ncbi:MAG TPA: hypothetical protein PK559_03545 [Ignavibacteriaceae bacterium]|nr:hypothetical protein [Ignavibacteriaceae bacterium]
MKSLFIIFILNILTYSQGFNELLGKVSYLSNQLVYVEFKSTNGIIIGDTLFIRNNGQLSKALIVEYLSSKSSACVRLGNIDFAKGDEVIAIIRNEKKISDDKVSIDTMDYAVDSTQFKTDSENKRQKKSSREFSRGKFSVQSYSMMDNYDSYYSSQRWRYTLKYSSNQLYDEKVSFNSYMTYSFRGDDRNKFQITNSKYLKVYDFSLKYSINKKSSFSIGRVYDNSISSMGATDGAIYKNDFDIFEGGIVLGKRSNTYDNIQTNILPQFGFFLSRTDKVFHGTTFNTVSFFQQMNRSIIDRRFLYFQHHNDFIPITQFNFSTEVDFFTLNNGIKKSELTLTSIYFNALVSPNKITSFNLSYDGRKDVVYIETYKNFIDSLYENETRHGFKIGANIRPIQNVFVGLNFGKRFMDSDNRRSENYGAYFSWYQIPSVNSNFSMSFTNLVNSYSNGNSIQFHLSKSFYDDLFNGGISYGFTDLAFSNNVSRLKYNSIGFELSHNLFDNSSINLNSELVTSEGKYNLRINVELSINF